MKIHREDQAYNQQRYYIKDMNGRDLCVGLSSYDTSVAAQEEFSRTAQKPSVEDLEGKPTNDGETLRAAAETPTMGLEDVRPTEGAAETAFDPSAAPEAQYAATVDQGLKETGNVTEAETDKGDATYKKHSENTSKSGGGASPSQFESRAASPGSQGIGSFGRCFV